MRVIDHEPQWWFLLEKKGEFFIDVNCSHSFIGYDVTVKLNSEETTRYKDKGRDFLSWLAEDIHNSVPVLKISHSPYKDRDISKQYSDEITAAVADWARGDSATTLSTEDYQS
jgi:hypothetical protein